MARNYLPRPIYIVTNNDGHWGIQARFGADYLEPEADTSGLEARAFTLIKSFAVNQANHNSAACAELLNYPHFEIGIGKLVEHASIASYPPSEYRIDLNSMITLQTGQRTINVALEILVSREKTTQELEAVLNITDRDNHLGMQAWSLLDPGSKDETPESPSS